MTHPQSPKPGKPFEGAFAIQDEIAAAARSAGAVAAQTRTVGVEIDEGWQRERLRQIADRRSGGDFAGRDRLAIPVTEVRARRRVVLSADNVLVYTEDYVAGSVGHLQALPDLVDRLAADLQLGRPDVRLADTKSVFDPAELDRSGLFKGRLLQIAFPDRTGRPDPDDQRGEALLQVVDVLHENGFAASLDHVVPLNIVMKIRGGVRKSGDSIPSPADLGTDPEVIVAIVDTGVETTHRIDEWLRGVEDKPTIDQDGVVVPPTNADPLDRYPLGAPDLQLDFGAGHGTFVSGIVQQISPETTVLMYRAIDSDGIGSEVEVALNMIEAAIAGATVINLSLGTDTLDNQAPLALGLAMRILQVDHAEVVVVATAGNAGSVLPTWPSALPGVVSVGALEANGQPAPWSNRGPWLSFSTIGQGVLSTFVPGQQPDDGYGPADFFDDAHLWGVGTGTSFAAPQISGAIARLLHTREATTAKDAVLHLKRAGRPFRNFGHLLEILPGTPPAP